MTQIDTNRHKPTLNDTGKPLYAIDRDVLVRLGVAVRYSAQIYADKIRVYSPAVPHADGYPYSPYFGEWPLNPSLLEILSNDITITSRKVVDAVITDMTNNQEADAWVKIARALAFYHLENSSY